MLIDVYFLTDFIVVAITKDYLFLNIVFEPNLTDKRIESNVGRSQQSKKLCDKKTKWYIGPLDGTRSKSSSI